MPLKDLRKAAALLLCVLIFSGCAHYGPDVKHGAAKINHRPNPAAVPYFDYRPDSLDLKPGPFRDWGLYEVQELKLPLTPVEGAKQDQYTLHYYRPKGKGPFPGVVILPITRGDYFTQVFAVYLAERGYACLRFESTRNFTGHSYKTLKSAEALLRNYIIDIRRGTDWLQARPEVDPDRLGIMGISLGAIVGSVVMAADPRFQAGAFLLGGGNLAGIIHTSEEGSLIRFRDRVLEHEQMKSDQFEEAAAIALAAVDPLRYAERLDPEKVLMISGRYDQVILKKYVIQLWEAAGHPELVFIPAGHYSAALFLAYARAKTLAHFQKHLR